MVLGVDGGRNRTKVGGKSIAATPVYVAGPAWSEGEYARLRLRLGREIIAFLAGSGVATTWRSSAIALSDSE